MNPLIERINRLNFHLQYLIVLAFPSNSQYLHTYYTLLNKSVLSTKLKDNAFYTQQIIEHLDYPTHQEWYENRQLKSQEWLRDGKLYRDSHNGCDLPARIKWYRNGQVKSQEWCKDGRIHRDEDLPAHIEWYKNGQLKCYTWYKYGEWHRDGDFPSIIVWKENGQIRSRQWWKKCVKIKGESY